MKAKTAFIAGDVVDQAIQRAKIAGEEKWFETLRTHAEWATGEQKWMVLECQAARIKKLYAELETVRPYFAKLEALYNDGLISKAELEAALKEGK